MHRVLHVIETMAPHEGGPPRVVAGLAVAQRALGLDTHILSGDAHPEGCLLQYWQQHVTAFPAAQLHALGGGPLVRRAAALRAWLHRELRDFDVVHIHQLWRLVPTLTARACRRAGVPYLIAPHTSLSTWALGQKRAKKLLARHLLWNRLLHGAAGFHALNELEAQEIRGLCGERGPPVFVVPNGVSLAEFSPPARLPPAALGATPAPFVLFLARLHTMKGPDLLLEAFSLCARQCEWLQLVLAGPDFGMRAQLERRVAKLGLGARVRFLGLVAGEERLWLLQNALCLAQPSRDEGFSLSILEAMACARPVVISERCKFPEVAHARAGLVVPQGIAELGAALCTYAGDAAQCRAAGRAARALIERMYTWEKVAEQTRQMYERALAGHLSAAPSPG